MLKTVGFPSERTGDQTIVDGNLVIGTAGKGIDFSADPSAPGMTSELLDDYEEGTWTPTDASGASLSFTTSYAKYTKIGNLVTATCYVTYPTTASTAAAKIGGLPFVCPVYGAATTYSSVSTLQQAEILAGATIVTPLTNAAATIQNAIISGQFVILSLTYQV